MGRDRFSSKHWVSTGIATNRRGASKTGAGTDPVGIGRQIPDEWGVGWNPENALGSSIPPSEMRALGTEGTGQRWGNLWRGGQRSEPLSLEVCKQHGGRGPKHGMRVG